MNESESIRVGKRGTLVLPATLRRRFGIEEGATLIAEATDEGILLRPAVVLPVEAYTPRRRAEFLLNNVTDLGEYQWAVREVRKLGVDPDQVPHDRPTQY
jgi:AbrB family looped-hinge helix DNA binding protein